MKRVLLPLGVLILFLVVIRFIVTPLAAQREGRRNEGLPALSALPSECDRFVQRRNSHRKFPPQLWAEGKAFPLERALDMGMPRDEIETVTGLRLFRSGEWCFAGSREHWWLLGPMSSLQRSMPEAEVMDEEKGILRAGGMAARAHGRFFLLASSESALELAQGGWLDRLPIGRNAGDLLISGDLLLYQRDGGTEAIAALREIEGHILAEGLSWGEGGLELLGSLNPLPVPAGGEAGDLPYLRRSAPWDPEGEPLPLMKQAGEEDLSLRFWGDGYHSAFAQVIAPAGEGASP